MRRMQRGGFNRGRGFSAATPGENSCKGNTPYIQGRTSCLMEFKHKVSETGIFLLSGKTEENNICLTENVFTADLHFNRNENP